MSVEDRFRKWLRDQLRLVGRSQADLAADLGLERSAVTKMIGGTRSIKLIEQKKIEEFILEAGGAPFGDDASHKLVPTGLDLRLIFNSGQVGGDYVLVLTHAALVERALCERLGRKADIDARRVRSLVPRETLSERDLDALEALFRLRDVFVHSPAARSLEEPSLEELARRVITGGTVAPAPGNIEMLRKAFAISTSMLSYLISFGGAQRDDAGSSG